MGTVSTVSNSDPISCSLPGRLGEAIAQSHKHWDDGRKTERLWARDTSLWDGSHTIPDLSWLDLIDSQIEELSNLKALSAEVKEDGFTHLVLLATDGSAGAADALRQASCKQNGCLEWIVLDTTDPSAIRDVETRINPARTLFCTLHASQRQPATDLLARYFFERTRDTLRDDARLHFIAVSTVEPSEDSVAYHHVYSNAGSTPSPFSDLGLVPVAYAGHDIEKLLKGARHMAQLCRERDSHRNPGVALGLLLGTALTKFGRDKLTVVCSPSLRALGSWMGRLVSPFVPVVAEPPAAVDTYGDDRVFIQLGYTHEHDREIEQHLAALEQAGHPVVRLVLEDAADLGESIVEWQIAASVASAVSGRQSSVVPELNPPPGVRERALLTQSGITLFADESYAGEVLHNGDTAGGVIRRHLDRLKPGDFFGVVAHVPDRPDYEEILQNMRQGVLESKSAATVLGFGPAFLAGAETSFLHSHHHPGVLLFITCETGADIAIPEASLSFGQATAAGARRDFETLAQLGHAIIRVHLGPDVAKALTQLQDLVCAAVEH